LTNWPPTSPTRWYPDGLRYLPNILTLLRVALTPFVVVLLATRRSTAALALFAVAGATDAIDGWLARRLRVVSPFGAYMDPVADKLLLSVTFPALAWSGQIPWWIAGVVVARDLLILAAAGALWAFTSIRGFTPSVWGKASTLAQIVAAVAVMSGAAPLVVKPLLAAAVCLAFVSGLHYLARAIAGLRA